MLVGLVGLVLGSLCGLITSLFRFRAFGLAVKVSSSLSIVAILAIVAFLVKAKSAQGGDAQMAFITILVLGFFGFGVLIALGLVFGALLGLINGQKAWNNAITLVLDYSCMFICSVVIQLFMINSIRQFDVVGLRQSKAQSENKIQALHNHMPPPYKSMDLAMLRADIFQKDHEVAYPGPPVPQIVRKNLKEIDEIEHSTVNEPDVASYTRDYQRRASFHIVLGLSWLASAFVFPYLLKRRDQVIGPAGSIPPVSQ